MALKRSPFIDPGIGGILLKLELGPFILLERAIPRFDNERSSLFLFFLKLKKVDTQYICLGYQYQYSTCSQKRKREKKWY